jgi:N-methylhydantoinase B
MATANTPAVETLDPVTVQVIRNAFVAIADEMKITMIKTAYNDLLYEVQDFGIVICDRRGELIAQSDTMPVFISVLPDGIKAGIERYGEDGFADGDIVLANDPFSTGTHISDTSIYLPVFHHGELVAFVGCMAHWADIGGKSPGGWCPDSTDVFQEGLRFDHVKIAEGGEVNEVLMRVIWDNVRLPVVSRGDYGAQLASCKTGIRRIQELYDRYGADTLESAVRVTFQQGDRRMRAALGEIPNGTYEAHTFLDHDGVERDHELKVALTLRVSEDEVVADFTGSSPVARGPVNCPLLAVAAGVQTAMKGLTLPTERTNSGHFRSIEVTAPPNTVVNPRFPAPVDSYGYVYQMAAELVLRALADVLPDRCPAGSYPLFLVHFFRLERERSVEARTVSESAFVFVDPPVGGSGASAAGDGASGLICLLDGDAPSPVAEMIEAKYPLRLERYELNPESAGPGRHRGGMGTSKTYVFLEEDLFCQVSVEGTHYPGWGLQGGEDAEPSGALVRAGAEGEELVRDKVGFVGPFAPGERIIAMAGGGGGWGDPLERDPQHVLTDVRNEFFTPEQVARDYGVVIVDGAIDAPATEERRRELREARA